MAQISSVQGGAKKDFTWKKAKEITKLADLVLVSNEGTDDATVEIGGTVEPEVLRVDALTQIQIKYNVPEDRRYATINGPFADVASGTVLITGIEEITTWEHWDAYTGGETVAEGQLVKGVTDTNTYIVNIGGVKKSITYDSQYNTYLYGRSVASTGVVTEAGTIEIHEGHAADEGYKALFRWSGNNFQVAYLNTKDTYKTL